MTRRTRSTDEGFTLAELLVVMVIIGLLAGLAIPTLLRVQRRAYDTSTKTDVGSVAKAITSYFVDGRNPLTLNVSAQSYVLSDAAAPLASCPGGAGAGFCVEGHLSRGTGTPTTGQLTTNLTADASWCVALGNPSGELKNYRFTANAGIDPGTC